MIDYKRGDVVLVEFPFSDQTATKKRPAVIVSCDRYNKQSSDVMIIAVTSKIETGIEIGTCLLQNWQDSGLLKPSMIKSAISTIEKKLIIKKLGVLSREDIEYLDTALKELLELFS